VIALAVVGYGISTSVGGGERRVEVEHTVVARSPVPARLPFTGDLDLIGVIMAGDASTAIIADPRGGQRAYRIGDAVRAGLVLQEIARDGVVLAAGEERLRLPLKRSAAAASAASADERSSALPAEPGVGPSSGPAWGSLRPEQGGGLRVEDLKPGGPYARLGLQAGDVLLRASGTPLDSPEQLRVFVNRLRVEGQGEVELLRDGRFETLRFGPG
jgi:type II secretory pathway component PulC